MLATNGDVLLGEALVGLLARRELDPGLSNLDPCLKAPGVNSSTS